MTSSSMFPVKIPDHKKSTCLKNSPASPYQNQGIMPDKSVTDYWQSGVILCVCLPITTTQWSGQYGLIYELVQEKSGCYAAVLLENGEDLGLIHLDTMPIHFVRVPLAPARYTYLSGQQLQTDWRAGHFENYFIAAATYYDNY